LEGTAPLAAIAMKAGFSAQWFQGTISVAIVLAALYVLGEIATAVAGRRLLAAFDYLMTRISIVQ
jgi:uncharacterized membrane protein